jgi:hypothetical protein
MAGQALLCQAGSVPDVVTKTTNNGTFNMNLYIMTRGRIGAQRTYDSIPYSWRDRTYLVVPEEEMGLHFTLGGDDDLGKAIPTIAVPAYVDNYSKKMKYIIEDGMRDENECCCILDDDLIFSHQIPKGLNPDGTVKMGLKTLEGADTERLLTLFGYMELLLEDTALVGVHPRQMGHLQKPPYNENGKVICIQGINRRLVGTIPDIDRFPILADVVLNATLLERGQGNKIMTTWFHDWGSCNAPGGCSLYRTPEMQAEACYWLEERFGPYIKAVEKEAKDGWLGGKRVDFRGQWKALYKAGAARVLDKGAGEDT